MNLSHQYAAGFFDGEGTITLSKMSTTSKYRTPCVTITSTTLPILECMKLQYGGHIISKKIYKTHHKLAWSWVLTYNATISFLEDIYPYMLEPEKRYRTNLVLTDYSQLTPRNGKYTTEMHEAKLHFEHKFFHPD